MRQVVFTALLMLAYTSPELVAQTRPAACDHSQDLSWFTLIGSDPAIQTSVTNNTRTQKSRVCGLLMPADAPVDPNTGRALPVQPWEQVADDVSGFVNVYKLSGNADYKDLAQYGADWLASWNDYLIANRDPSISYLGWYTANREGWFNLDCAASHNFHLNGDGRSYVVDSWRADEAWDTAAAVRALLKYSEIGGGTSSTYFQRAKTIVDNWPSQDHSSGDGNPDTPGLTSDGPYAAAGMRWYAKSNEPCEIRYVKNTNVVFGEQLFRVYRLSGDVKYLQLATRVLNSQLWEIITHNNFGYNSYLLYTYRPGTIYADVMAPDNDATTVTHSDANHPDDVIVCKNPNPSDQKSGSSCWDHLGFEAYDVYTISLLINDIDPSQFPVSTTQADVANATAAIMAAYRTSIFGNTSTFPWGLVSPTYVTSYNCAQRFSSDSSAMNECLNALPRAGTGGSIFYSLVPDALVGQSPLHQ